MGVYIDLLQKIVALEKRLGQTGYRVKYGHVGKLMEVMNPDEAQDLLSMMIFQEQRKRNDKELWEDVRYDVNTCLAGLNRWRLSLRSAGYYEALCKYNLAK